MKKCNNCLYDSNHPFGMSFKNNMCLGCITHMEKYSLNWSERYNYLENEINLIKNKNISYDCVIPITGDAEDYFVVQEVLKLKLNPLIVAVNSYFNNDIGWQNIHHLITYFDLDSWIYNPEKQTYKELIKTSLRKYNHMYLPWLQLHTSFPVHVANEKSISLIIWGGNQAIEQVGKFSHNDSVEMTSWSRIEHDLFGENIDSLIGNGAQVNERKLNYYYYPKNLRQLSRNVKGLYLSNYMPWDPLKQNQMMALKHGFKPQKNPYSFDPYERAGSSVYYQIHDILKFERLGYRKISDHCSREIRHGRINKNEAEKIENFYKNNQINISPFFNWLGVTNTGFDWFVKHRLLKSRKLICDSEVLIKDIDLPEKLKLMLITGSQTKEEFITYGKGVEI